MLKVDYFNKSKRLLVRDKYLNYEYFIFDDWKCPHVKIVLPRGHRLQEKDDLSKYNISFHSKVNFSRGFLVSDIEMVTGWVLSWNYDNEDDFIKNDFTLCTKKWTTEEIQEEVLKVIEQLEEINNAKNIFS